MSWSRYGIKTFIIFFTWTVTNVNSGPDRSGQKVVDPDQTATIESDQGLHCLPFSLHLLETLLNCMVQRRCSNFRTPTTFFMHPNFSDFYLPIETHGNLAVLVIRAQKKPAVLLSWGYTRILKRI